MERQHSAATTSGTKTNEMVAEVIAGPETARRLGVPVGTVVEARHVVTVDGCQTTPIEDTIISPEDADRILGRESD